MFEFGKYTLIIIIIICKWQIKQAIIYIYGLIIIIKCNWQVKQAISMSGHSQD
jgi:hypothetical protein